MPTAPISAPGQLTVQHYAQLLDLMYPGKLSGTNKTLGQEYTAYMKQHPHADPTQVYQTVVFRLEELGHLPGTIASQIGGAAGIIGAAGIGTGKGLAIAGQNLTGGGGQSDWTHLMIRLAEFGIGAILLIIGFNAIVSKTKGYQKIETVVAGSARRAVPGV